LGQLALQVWPYPALEEDAFKKFATQEMEQMGGYTLEHFEHLTGDMLQLFESLRIRIKNLDSAVREEFKKNYIAYKTTTNFVDIVPQKTRLRLTLNVRFDELDDPQGLCRDVTDTGRWGNGDAETTVSSLQDIEYAMFLIRQSFDKYADDEV
jgi:predicted transport protein